MSAMQNQVVCITGASRGLGASLARTFGDAGAHLVLGARNQEGLSKVTQSLPSAIGVQCDVGLVADVEGLVEAAMAEHGRLDVMINNAGMAVYGPLLHTREADFDQMVATNIKGTYFGSQAALRAMMTHHRGLIINISSIAGRLHLPNESAYSPTKWAVQGITGVLRLEAAKHNVRVTSVVAGGINTPFWREQDFYPFPPEVVPERDFMDPDEVARTILSIATTSDAFVVPEIVCLPLLPTDRNAGS